MSEALAALFLVFGAAIALIAAIGVARLPDAFLRMHAATKAGVVGAGLMLVGAGLAFGTGEAWLRVGLIVLFLLVTVPIASHALGRAAYIGGAPLWAGSGEDALAGVLPRKAIDHPAPAAAGPGQPAAARPPAIPAAAAPRRLLVALAQGEHSEAALRAGLGALAHPGAEVTLLSLLCARSLTRVGPMPPSGAAYAQRLVEKRMAAARAGAAALAARLEAACAAGGLALTMRHEEGDALLLLERAAARHDVTLLPRGAWFDQGQVLLPGEAEARASAVTVPGLLLLARDFAAPSELYFLHEGDAASTAALERFLALGAFARSALTIGALDGPEAAGMLADALALAAARGWRVQAGQRLLHRNHPVPATAFAEGTLAVIPAHSPGGHPAWRSLRDGPASVLLA